MASFRERFYPDSRELHSTRLLKSKKGPERAIALFEALAEAGCMPIASISEKRYAVAGKIVETFLDPYYNPRAPAHFGIEAGPLMDTDAKQELAQTFYDLPDEYLNEFAAAYRAYDAALLSQSLDRLSTVLRILGHDALEWMLLGSKDRLNDIASDEGWVTQPGNKGAASLNFPIFAGLLSTLEEIGRRIGADVRLVHDNSEEFSESFRSVFERYKSLTDLPTEGEFRFENGRLVHFGLRAVDSFDMVASDDSLLIQAADVLAGSLRTYCSLSATGAPVPPALLGIASRVLPSALFPPQYCGYLGSKQFAKQVFRPAIEHLRAITAGG